MPQDLVSVGIPTYNRSAQLRRALESITAQTYQNLEILVSDNCSENIEIESVESVISEFMKLESRSRLRRLLLSYREGFGELFYGVFRRAELMNGKPALDFERYEVIGSPMKAMLAGDAYVTEDFSFTKDVSGPVYIWTYLCAKAKS